MPEHQLAGASRCSGAGDRRGEAEQDLGEGNALGNRGLAYADPGESRAIVVLGEALAIYGAIESPHAAAHVRVTIA